MKSTTKKIIQLTLSLALAGLFGLSLFLMGLPREAAVVYAAGETCFATINGSTVYSSTDDASAVQTAVDNADPTAVIKVAGTCAGVQQRNSLTQTVYISQSVTLQGGYVNGNWDATPDPDTNPTVLDAQSKGRVVYIPSGVNVTLDGLTMQNGLSSGHGGGIHNAGTLTVTNSHIISNTAQDLSSGGGLYNDIGGVANLKQSTFANNYADDAGGGIDNSGLLTVTNSTFANNYADDGGGGINNSGLLTVTNSTFANNYADDVGGGIHNSGLLTVTNSTFSANVANVSGGIHNATASGTVALIHTTFSGNSADGGLAFANIGGTVALTGTIVAGLDPYTCDNIGVGTVTATHSLFQVATCGFSDGVNGNIVGVDPLLGPLADNGGDTETHALLAGSPALDVIPAGACTVSTDQRGVDRPQKDNCDIGAVESRQSYSLTLSGGNNQQTEINTAFSQPLQVTLVASGTTIGQPGQVITFTGPSSGASLSKTVITATTNAGGVAVVTPTANSEWGDYQVTASSGVTTEPVTFTLENLPVYTLTTATAGDGSGSVTPGGVYVTGTVVTITATASADSTFTGWSGDATGTTNPLTVTMTSDKNITATFTLDTTPPTTPSLTSPANGSVITTTQTPTFNWTEATDNETGVISYTLRITGSSGVQTIPTTTSTYIPPSNLDFGVYTWTVQAHDVAGNFSGYVSPPFTFTLKAAGTEIYLPVVFK